jgi:membrane-associated phospholipid phosphatase
VTPFCLPDIEPYVSGPPPALDSPEYAEALNEVKSLGSKNSTTRTADQSQIAVFWSDFSYTAMPPGHWQEITGELAFNRNLGLAEKARLFALVRLAQADSAIVCWETKYRYNLWRPVTAIQRADEDGNPATEADPDWQQNLNSPPFPTYTSGHSTFSKASATVLALFFGTDSISFTTTSDSLPGVYRSYTSLSGCADEVGMSRIYCGIHFQFDNRAGKLCGQKIAQFVSANYLLPNAQLPSIHLESINSGTPILYLHGHAGSTFVLETTGDFKQWLPIATNIAQPGGVIFADSTRSAEQRFYRIREQDL